MKTSAQKDVYGSYSGVVFSTDRGYVEKRPKGAKKSEKLIWYEHQKRAVSFLKLKIRSDGIYLPKIIEFDTNHIVETYQKGLPLTAERFDRLAPSIRQKIVNDFARFLLKIHQTRIPTVYGTLNFKFLKSSIYFKAFCLPNSFLKNYNRYLTMLKETEISDIKVLCYRDLKAEHLLYDDKVKKLSVIDFGAVGFDIPLREFCLDNPLRCGLSLSFLKNVICAYNEISNNKIDISFIKAYLYCAAFNELVFVCRKEKIPLQDIIGLGKILRDFLENLEIIFREK